MGATISQARLIPELHNGGTIHKKIQTEKFRLTDQTVSKFLRPPKAWTKSTRTSPHSALGEARGNCSMENNARQSGVEPPFDCAQDEPQSKKGAKLLNLS